MYELFTYGGGDFLRHIFNGIAMIFGDGDYVLLLRAVVIIGVVVLLFSALLKGGIPELKGFVLVIFVLLGLFVPRVSLLITDRIIPANSSVVANVPFGPAVAIGFFSLTSDYLTRSFETVFSLPADLKYSGNGLLFANNLVEKSTQFELTDPRVAHNFREFWKACVFYDLALKLYTWEELSTANDTMGFLRENTANSRYFPYTNTLNQDSIINCRIGLSGQMTTDLDNAVTAVSQNQAIRLFPTITDINTAVSKLASSMPLAVQHLTGLSRTASQIIQQNVMANSFTDGMASLASEVNAQAAIQRYALAKAEAERKATFTTMGEMAKQKLPVMQHMLEAFIYAVSPIIIILMMLPSLVAKVAMGYMKAVLWINLWPPLYAVLHFGMTFYSAAGAKAAVTVATSTTTIQSLSMYTNTALGNELNNNAILAGYLSISIPMIAWMLVSGSGAVMASLSNRLLSSYEAPVASATAEASAGNFSIGNLQMDNTNFAKNDMSPSSTTGGLTFSDGAGNAIRFGSGGHAVTDTAASTGPTAITDTNAFIQAASGQLAEAQSVTQSATASLGTANSTLAQSMTATSHALTNSTSAASSDSVSVQENYKTAEQATVSLVDEFASKHGVTDSNRLNMALVGKVGGEAGISTGKGDGGVMGKLSAGGRATAETSLSYLTDEQQTALEKFQSSEQYTSALEHQESALKSWTAVDQSGVSDSLKSDFQAASSAQSSASLAQQAAVQNQSTASKVLSETESQQFGNTSQRLDDLYRFMGGRGIDLGQAQELMQGANAGDPYDTRQLNRHVHDYINQEVENISTGISQRQLEASNVGGVNTSMSELRESGLGGVIQANQTANAVVDGRSDENNAKATDNSRVNESSITSSQNQVGATISGGQLGQGHVVSLDNFNAREDNLKTNVDSQIESTNFTRAADDGMEMLQKFVKDFSPSKRD